MEVQLDKRYPVQASLAQAWAVLSDLPAVARCMPGAAITEQVNATQYKGTVKSKVGPAVMQFGGDIEVLALDAAAHALQLLGKGADRSGSSASMKLTAHLEKGDGEAPSVLVGSATVTVSGKLAQLGSRLLVPVSDALLKQFADNFSAAAAAVPVAAPASPPPQAVSVQAVLTTEPALSVDARVAQAVSIPQPQEQQTSPAPTSPAPAAAAPAPANELHALRLLWTVFTGWLKGLFSRRA